MWSVVSKILENTVLDARHVANRKMIGDETTTIINYYSAFAERMGVRRVYDRRNYRTPRFLYLISVTKLPEIQSTLNNISLPNYKIEK